MQFPTTKTTLLNNLNGNDSAWSDFFRKYKDIIIDLGKFRGLTDFECDDLVQIVMLRFSQKITNGFVFDRSLAKFRTFFCCLIKGCIYDLLRQRNRYTRPIAELPEISDGNTPDELLDLVLQEKWRKILYDEAMIILAERIDTKTFQAFVLYSEKSCPVKEICALLKISAASVYTAKNRCIELLQKIIKDLQKNDPESLPDE